MPGEFGQANSYCVGMKMVTPSGEILEINEKDPGLLQAARSSYGLFGIVVEATFKVRPLQAMEVEHRASSSTSSSEKLPELFGRGQSIMMYIFPYLDRVTVELRRYTGPADKASLATATSPWRVRNYSWKTLSQASATSSSASSPRAGSAMGWSTGFNRVTQVICLPTLEVAATPCPPTR